ncbi:MAG: rRNA maturation RNase YbeY [Chloroflexi bacterium]|nr:rRNA maturation RNase YbeY [Chloroflexota bacterium]|tara:strand:+ start:12601 stop:13113 length:513 start_codon:yes stop_codon:yes gene_type:complete
MNKILINIDSDFKKKISKKSMKNCIISSIECGALNNFDESVSLSITSNEKLKDLSGNFLGKNEATDVLAFPFNTNWEEGKLISKNFDNYQNFDHLGDIFISFPKIKDQAKTFKTGIQLELNIILAHGVLHLLGYDHKNKKMRQKMFTKTIEIIKHLKLDHIKAKLSLESR